MKNKRHLGFSTSVRVTPKLRPEVGRVGPPVLLGFKSDGQQVRTTGVLSYRNGGLVEYDACLTEDEVEVLTRLVASVADRVHALLLDDDERRGRSRNGSASPSKKPQSNVTPFRKMV
jgi:hypothetical protein